MSCFGHGAVICKNEPAGRNPWWALLSGASHAPQRTSRLGTMHADCQRHGLDHVFREVIQPESFNPIRFSQYARELSRAVQELSMPTIGEQLKAARADLAKARGEAAVAGSDAAGAAKAVLAEVSKVKAETADLLAEIAELTNGGPVLDETTPLPPAGPYPTYP